MVPERGKRVEHFLELATDEELARLSGGHPVALVGFPMKNLAGGGVHARRPVPQTQTGYVTAVTDYFLSPSSGHERNLVMHSLPGTGGASGCAIIDASGRSARS
jgi:hypothetical protein